MKTNPTLFAPLIESLDGVKVLTPLELNAMRFSGKKTIITEARLRRSIKKK